MAFQAKGESDEVMSEINVTPLVDVMLVLLVVFIVTAPLLTNSIKVNLPQTASNISPEQKRAVSVSVDAQGKVYMDRNETDLAALGKGLTALHDAEPDIAVHLNADRTVNYGLVAKVMSTVDRAGITKLSVLTSTE
jgi:biopolymer transport protein ExbD